MDAGSLNTLEELVLGLGLAVTAWVGLGILRRLMGYALSAGAFVAGLVLAASLFVYKPSRVYGWVEQHARTAWTVTPSSEELIDRGLSGLGWLEERLLQAKQTVDGELDPSPAAAAQPGEQQPAQGHATATGSTAAEEAAF